MIAKLRGAGIVAAAVGGLWIVTGSTLATTAAAHNPDLVLRLWPWSSTALAARAGAGLAGGLRAHDIADARRAMRLDATNLPAVRVLALGAAARGDTGRADALFDYGERLSRRDLATQMWLIEHYVTAGDVAGALAHYDRALRTSRAADGVLIPVLVQAFADRQVAGSIARLIAARPPWWRRFGSALLDDPANAGLIPRAFSALRLDVGVPDEASLLADGLARLTQTGHYASALALFRQAARGRGDGDAMVRNGGFDAVDPRPLPPFDWILTSDADLSASIEAVPGREGDRRLEVTSQRRSGAAARQLLVLAPGRYALRFESGAASQDAVVSPRLTVTCVGPDDRKLTEVTLAKTPSLTRVDFVVPRTGECVAQWLDVTVPGDAAGADSAMPWIDSIGVQPRG